MNLLAESLKEESYLESLNDNSVQIICAYMFKIKYAIIFLLYHVPW